jgi:hypothetical protein
LQRVHCQMSRRESNRLLGPVSRTVSHLPILRREIEIAMKLTEFCITNSEAPDPTGNPHLVIAPSDRTALPMARPAGHGK